MKICAIYNIWGDGDLLNHSIKNITPLVDGVIIVASMNSNYGEFQGIDGIKAPGAELFISDPSPMLSVMDKETSKRNFGLQRAIERGYTHFIMMDEDEFYGPEEFLKEKERFKNDNLWGLVCRVKCYFKSPTLTIGYDTTLVPFIHKIVPGLRFEFNKNYPFAWTTINGVAKTESKQIRIDPTRSMNIDAGVEWSDITMHHYSWVRKDIKKKIRNSTARHNIERSPIVFDYGNARPGYFCEFYGKTLEETPNVFGLPEINDSSI